MLSEYLCLTNGDDDPWNFLKCMDYFENNVDVSLCRLQQWLRRKNLDVPSDADSGPTASIRCPHGDLMPELAPGAKRLLVPEILWEFIHQTAMMVKPNDSVGCSTFSSDSEQCSFCSAELTEAAFSEDSLRLY